MATESPMRMVESGRARNWPSSKDSAMCGSQLRNMVTEELGLLLKRHRFHGDQAHIIPNRSGSAPPSWEGYGNLLAKQNSGLNLGLESLSDNLGHFESEEQLRSDPAYFAYYCSNVNLNPRLPPPLISQENRRLEELEDDRSPRQASDNWAENSPAFMSGQKTAVVGQHKSLVDLIQEDFPCTPSSVYDQSRSSSHATTDEPTDHDVHAVTLDVSAINLSEVPGSSGSADVWVDKSALDSHDTALISKNDSLAMSFSSLTAPDGAGSSQN
ncbi:hypothetical protein Pint_16852 [Pistacia integerrima]|uniref:Uncharacterized protein n=1 Tax=Pistacia integerrima TaxID=434235 RepID=A0ACC0Z904_9ROSI|nr:hypothetical protein Pint_16852 [Pistacia integerrima]